MSSHVSEASGTNESNDDHSSETPNRRSKVWEHFEAELVEVNGVMKAVCRYCGMKMATGKSGTNSLRNHIKDSCRKISDDDRQRFIATIKKPSSLGPFTFNNQRSRELMITWCIRADVPFNKIESISQFLGAFEEATRAFSADRFPTSHLFLDNVLCIHQALKNPAWQVNETIKDLAKAMDKKFDKYWEGGYNMALVIATILDPSKKMDFLEFFYDKVCRSFIDSEAKISLAKEWMTKYFSKYEGIVRRNGTDPLSQTTTVSRGTVGSPVLGKRRMEQEFAQFRTQRRATRIQKSELDAYLEDEHVRDDENFEILSWWKTNKNKYPVLSTMARDFLAIPLSTVSSESAFSLSGETLSDNRSSMTPETLEALVCVKDWLYKYPINEDRSLVVVP